MKYTAKLFLIIPLSALMSCSPGNKTKDKTLAYSTSAQMSVVRDLNNDERAIATRICYAYKSKGSNFRTSSYLGGSFTFSVSSKDCDGKKDNYQVRSILESKDQTSSVFRPESSDKDFEQSIQTSQSGFLAKLCTKIQNNQVISNTATEGNSKVQVTFFKNALDSYTIQHFSPSDDGVKITHAETFQVRTQFNISNGQILGMDEKFIKQETCAFSPDKFLEFNQQFSNFSL